MSDKNRLKQIVESAVSEVLEKHLPQVREDLVERVLEQIGSQLAVPAASSTPAADNAPAELLKAISAIHAGGNQKEILRGLLDSTVRYSGRAALFVVKAGAATGWEGRGFANNDGVKNFALDVAKGVAGRALQSRMTYTGTTDDMDSEFIAQLGAPSQDRNIVLPLLLKDKVAALIYADAGSSGNPTDDAALEVLVTSTSAWLEVISLRKQAQKDGGAEASVDRAETTPAPPVQSVSAFSDPFAGHSPMHAPKAAPIAEPVAHPEPEAEPEPVSAAAAAAPAVAKDAFAHLSPEDADTHRKAQRFARLLVDEIKLYNQVKVTEGRNHKDLYDRLKEDIEKSRSTYSKRYGSTAAASADYFSSELVRSLAEDDISIMGANFRR
jgi:hypothetical protein